MKHSIVANLSTDRLHACASYLKWRKIFMSSIFNNVLYLVLSNLFIAIVLNATFNKDPIRYRIK